MALTDVSMECLTIPNRSSNTIQSITSHHMLERNIVENSIAMEMMFWEGMDVFMRSFIAKY